MSHWPYIIVSYVLTIAGIAGIALSSWVGMRKAEAEAESVSRK